MMTSSVVLFLPLAYRGYGSLESSRCPTRIDGGQILCPCLSQANPHHLMTYNTMIVEDRLNSIEES